MRILLLNGPNLGRLGQRRPELYGRMTLPEVVQRARRHAEGRGSTLDHLQSNHEGALIDRIEALDFEGLIINPGALGHTSYALRDAIEGTERPTVEVHVSNVLEREVWRRELLLEDVVIGQVIGRGWQGYLDAVGMLLDGLASR